MGTYAMSERSGRMAGWRAIQTGGSGAALRATPLVTMRVGSLAHPKTVRFALECGPTSYFPTQFESPKLLSRRVSMGIDR